VDNVDYVNTFIAVAPDSAAETGITPPAKENGVSPTGGHPIVVGRASPIAPDCGRETGRLAGRDINRRELA